MPKIRIIEAGNELGLGGTEYVIQLYSKFLNKEHFEVTVLGIRAGGERVELIRQLGIKVIVLNNDLEKLKDIIRTTDVFHWHGDGTVDQEVFSIIKNNRPKLVIQTNIFGLYDRSPLYELIDYDLYVSKMILVRRMFFDRNLENDFSNKRKTLYNPVDVDQLIRLSPTDEEINTFKKENGLLSYFLAGRIGRPSDDKFDLITLEAFARFASKVGNAKFLLVGITPTILAYASTLKITEKLIIFDNTPDLKRLLLYYKCIDVFIAASRIGESFGMVIAEAMAVGTPVITISTEHCDNAQIELIDNNQTGLVVSRNSEHIAEALLYLWRNERLRHEFADAAKNKVIQEYKADRIVKSFENLVFTHLGIQVSNSEQSLLVDFSVDVAADYINRCSNLWQHSS